MHFLGGKGGYLKSYPWVPKLCILLLMGWGRYLKVHRPGSEEPHPRERNSSLSASCWEKVILHRIVHWTILIVNLPTSYFSLNFENFQSPCCGQHSWIYVNLLFAKSCANILKILYPKWQLFNYFPPWMSKMQMCTSGTIGTLSNKPFIGHESRDR